MTGRQRRRKTMSREERGQNAADDRDKHNFATGKMKRAGVYATRDRTGASNRKSAPRRPS